MAVSAKPVVYLHVGEPKTGTTFLQQVMWQNRPELARCGVLLPGMRPLAHWRASQDLCGVQQAPDDPVGPFNGAWDRLARLALGAPCVAVISHELFAAADAEQAARAVASFDEAELHVVLTVRDMATLLPAEWQESVKHRTTRAWDDWLGDVIDRESIDPDRRRWGFWRVHDTLEILRAWSADLPPERVHVITVPPRTAARDLLWHRFAEVIGIDPAAADTSRARSNASLGLAEVELVRRINQALPEQMPDWSYMHTVKDFLAQEVLAGRPAAGQLELPADRDSWACEQGQLLVDGLKASDYDIVGDLDDLLPQPSSGPRYQPGQVSSEQMLDASVHAIVSLVSDRVAAREQVRAAQELAGKQPTVKDALIALSERHAAMRRVRRGYWYSINFLRTIRRAARSPRKR
ncbi:MAG TPA: hypothetical protein VKB75_11475 [Jatrophihabitans sp.]|nr:hypothetical protein [Jatrophihabitans sp.]